MGRQKNLSKAKRQQKDEFYTLKEDVERELQNYTGLFVGKTVFCPCDDPERSQIFIYFVCNFEKLGLKRVIGTSFAAEPNRFTETGQMIIEGLGERRGKIAVVARS